MFTVTRTWVNKKMDHHLIFRYEGVEDPEILSISITFKGSKELKSDKGYTIYFYWRKATPIYLCKASTKGLRSYEVDYTHFFETSSYIHETFQRIR